MKIIVIGAGPAGLTTAIKAKNEKNDVLVLEKNNNILKKLLVTGAGHCNLFNKVFNNDCFDTSEPNILKDIINEHNINLVMPYLNELGILTKEKNGYLYPMAYTSYAVSSALKMTCDRKNIIIKTNEEVVKVSKVDNLFNVETKNDKYICDKLIVACGSKAYPQLGATDSALYFAKSLNIKCKEFLPSLTGLKTDNKIIKKWDKLRCDVKLSLYEDDKFIKSEIGEVQLTDYGISGICTFNLSSYIIKKLYNHKEIIKIDFLPMITSDFKSFIADRITSFPNNNPVELLEGLINYKVLYALFDDTNLIKKRNIELNDKDLELIFDLIKNYSINITGYNSYDSAQVCSGGILLSEINPNTFECINVKNLYFVGESLDVDGICGGYNLGFAWISGIICGNSINNC